MKCLVTEEMLVWVIRCELKRHRDVADGLTKERLGDQNPIDCGFWSLPFAPLTPIRWSAEKEHRGKKKILLPNGKVMLKASKDTQ